MRREYYALLGFVLVAVGLLSIILSAMGLQFSFLLWMDRSLGAGLAFLLRILMVLFGFVLMYLNLVDWKRMD